jgi:hypothetical protein
MKEKVVVFAGEDKFIKPRNRSYNVEKNYSNLVGDSNPPADYFPKDDLNRTTQSYTTIDVGGGGGGGGNVGSGGGIGVSTPQLDYQLPNTTIQPAPTTVAPTTVAPTTIVPTTVVPIVPLPFVTPIGLGVAPMGGSGGGGGGGQDKKEDKKNYWWLLLLLGLGAGLYIYKKKKK